MLLRPYFIERETGATLTDSEEAVIISYWGVLEAHRAPGPGQAVAGLVLAVFEPREKTPTGAAARGNP